MAGKARRSFLKRLILIMVSLMLLLFFRHSILGKRGYFELRKMEDQNEDLIQQIERLKSENEKIMDEIKSLKTDPKAIEKIAREELGLVRPGEIKIITRRWNMGGTTTTTSSSKAQLNGVASREAR